MFVMKAGCNESRVPLFLVSQTPSTFPASRLHKTNSPNPQTKPLSILPTSLPFATITPHSQRSRRFHGRRTRKRACQRGRRCRRGCLCCHDASKVRDSELVVSAEDDGVGED